MSDPRIEGGQNFSEWQQNNNKPLKKENSPHTSMGPLAPVPMLSVTPPTCFFFLNVILY